MGKLLDLLKSSLSKDWAKSNAVCCKCGYKWKVIYPKVPGGQYKLECPKCKARNSKIL